MSEEKPFKKAATEILTAPFDPEIYQEFWSGLKQMSFAVLVFLVRMMNLIMFPVSIPAMFLILRLPKREQDPWLYTLVAVTIGLMIAFVSGYVLYSY